jgi:hypothetical protein
MLPDRASICDSYWPTDELYKPNKQHWIGWLSEYAGPGYYGRKNSDRSAKFIYNHINSPPMLLWLNESARVSKELVRAACRVQAATQNGTSACSLIRRVLPWELVEGSLLKLRRRKILAAESGQQILHLTLHRRFFAEIAARTKRLSIDNSRLIGDAAWKDAITMQSYSATVTPEMLLRSSWSFEGYVVTADVGMRIMQYDLGVSWRLSGGLKCHLEMVLTANAMPEADDDPNKVSVFSD